jgi:hypothetical protein
MVTNELFLRNNLVDIKTGEKVVQSFNGNPISSFQTAQDKYILNDRIQLNTEVMPFAPIRKNKIERLLHQFGLKK